MLRLAALIVLVVVLAAAAVLAYGHFSFGGSVAGDVSRLHAEAGPAGPAVTAARLAALPEPARRYFAHAGIAAGTPIPRIVQLRQKGRIRSSTDSGWMDFEADETYSTNPPAFVWRAWFPTPVMPVVLGRDEYLGGEGSIVMKMLALVAVADEHGPELRAAGLMRYLNETMWFPAALLGDNFTISAVDDNSFSVAIADRGLTAAGTLIVDADGRPVNFKARRFNTASGSTENWETPLAGEARLGGLMLPGAGSAVWKLAAGDLDYIELTVTEVTYEH